MRIIYRDQERIFVFSSPKERGEYFLSQEMIERKRHSEAIREIHADYLKELSAENSYNKGTRQMIESLRSKSVLEQDIRQIE